MCQSIANINWDVTVELIVVENEGCQAGAEAKVGRNYTREHVVPHVKALQLSKAADAWWHLTVELVGAQV